MLPQVPQRLRTLLMKGQMDVALLSQPGLHLAIHGLPADVHDRSQMKSVLALLHAYGEAALHQRLIARNVIALEPDTSNQ